MGEFKKTPGGKSLFNDRKILILFTSILFVVDIILSIYVEETSGMKTELEVIDRFTGFMLILTVFQSAYFKLNFTSWLKNKYYIKRW